MDALCDPTGREELASLLCVSEVATEWLSAFYLALGREHICPNSSTLCLWSFQQHVFK